jgi:hypothetical protein
MVRWPEAASGPSRGRDAAVLAAAAAAILVSLVQLIDFGYGRDQGIFAMVARTILDGGVPYRDAWDFKPPGIYFVYALGGSQTAGIRVLEAAALCSLVAAFAKLSNRYVGDWRPGVFGAALAILTHVQLEFWHTAQPESFGGVLVAWGLVFAADATAHHSSHRSKWLWAASGACYGTALLLKPMIGAAAAASVVMAVWGSQPDGSRGVRQRASAVLPAFVIGGSVPVVMCLAFFVVRGGVADLTSAVFVFAPKYASLAWQDATAVDLLGRLARAWLYDYGVVNAAGLALLLLPPPTDRQREGLIHVGCAIAVLLAGVFVQARLFAYHFGAVFPLTSLLAGWGFWRLWRHSRLRWSGVLVFAALIAALVSWHSATTDLPDTFRERMRLRIVAWLHPEKREAIRDHLYSLADYRARENRRVASWIALETAPDSTIYVYGFTPEIYVAANRRAASRFIYNVPQRAPWSQAEARAELIADLHAARPDVVLVEHHDLMPWVTGSDADSAADLESFAMLRGWLASQYGHVSTFGEFDVYRRASRAANRGAVIGR